MWCLIMFILFYSVFVCISIVLCSLQVSFICSHFNLVSNMLRCSSATLRLFRVLRWEYSSTMRALLISAVKQVRESEHMELATESSRLQFQVLDCKKNASRDCSKAKREIGWFDAARNPLGIWKPSSPKVAWGIRCTSLKARIFRVFSSPPIVQQKRLL